MRYHIDREPQHGQKTPTAYRVWCLDGDVYLETYVDDRDVVELGYDKAIDVGVERLKDVYYR